MGELRYVLAAGSLGAGLIHLTAVPDHVGHPVAVTFFVLLAGVQVGWALSVVRRPNPALLKMGAALSLGVVGIWLLSRTTGLPGVPGAEEAEPVGLKDGVASTLELLLVAGAAAPVHALRQVPRRLASGVAVSVIGVVTAIGLSASGHGHRHDGVQHNYSEALGAAHHHEETSHPVKPGAHDDHRATRNEHDAAGEHHHHERAAVHHVHGKRQVAGSVHVHDAGHEDETAHNHDHSAAARTDDSHGHGDVRHEQHDDGARHDDRAGHEGHNTCADPLPENRAVTTVQEVAEFFLGVSCAETDQLGGTP